MKMTTAQVAETSVTVNNNSPIQDYVHQDDQTQPTFEMTPGFKPFTDKNKNKIELDCSRLCLHQYYSKLSRGPYPTYIRPPEKILARLSYPKKILE